MSIATAGIRLAEMGEAEAISHLSRDTIEAGLPWRWQPADIERFMRSTRHNVIVAEETPIDTAPIDPAAFGPARPDLHNGKVMSGFAVMGYGDNDAYLALLSVKPEWRRRSIARAMVQWLMKCAEVGGVKRVDVELRADNSAALALYQSLQFAEIARKPGGYYGTVTQVRMRRVLRR
jgi:ribosomal-protein-alanine N-acetyltransferase